MLRGIADFAMQGRWRAAMTTAILSVAAMLLPPLNYLASGVIALTTLRMGPREGAKVVTATVIVFALLAGLLLNQVWVAGLLLLTSWLPVFLITLALGYTRSLSVSILAGAGLGLITVLLFHAFIPDLTAWWEQLITPFMTTLAAQPGWAQNATETAALTTTLASMMTGFIAAGVSFNAVIGLMIGRSWQASLYTPGAFGEEFRQLRLGMTPAIVTAVIMGVSLTSLSDVLPLLADFLPVMIVVFALQGLAVVHALMFHKKKRKFWLVTMYILLVIMLPQMAMILATAGVLDQWFNFRKRSNVE